MAKSKNVFKRVVVKFGTGLLTGGTDVLNQQVMADLADQIARVHQEHQIVTVSSGAIAAGRSKLNVGRHPHGIPYKQVFSSVGQSRLMNVYEQLFKPHKITVAQALLTKNDISDRSGYLNARNTLLALIELKVLCIVNENDVVAVDELKEEKFGDNDNLSAMVANLIDADLLLILTDIAGLYTADPRHDRTARLIPEVSNITPEIEIMACGSSTGTGVGGMMTKIEAARLATSSGVTVIVASGMEKDVIVRVLEGERLGTRFLPRRRQSGSRARWMLSGLCTHGRLVIDSGAVFALKKKHGSLLAAGIREVTGNFERGDIVNIYDPDGTNLGCGISNYSSGDIECIKGKRSSQITGVLGYHYGSEVVHRNNLVVL